MSLGIAAEKERAQDRASERNVVNGAALAAKKRQQASAAQDASKAEADAALAREARDKIAAGVTAARAAVATCLQKVTALTADRYGDPAYWEERHAKGRRDEATYEWYTDYPDAALRQVLSVVLPPFLVPPETWYYN